MRRTAAFLVAMGACHLGVTGQESAGQDLAISGTVVEQGVEGKPVAGATIELLDFRRRDAWPPSYTKTDDAGAFSFRGLSPGWFEVRVRARGFLDERQPGIELGPSAGRVLRFEMVPGRDLVIEVFDVDSRPVGGALVQLAGDRCFRLAITDPKGVAVIEGVDDGPWLAYVLSRKFAREFEAQRPADGRLRLVFTTEDRPDGLSFRAIEAGTGVPIRGAELEVLIEDPDGATRREVFEEDADGVLRPRIEGTPIEAIVRAPNHVPARYRAGDLPGLRGGDPVLAALDPAGAISGQVRGHRPGQLLAGIYGHGLFDGGRLALADQGSFVFEGLLADCDFEVAEARFLRRTWLDVLFPAVMATCRIPRVTPDVRVRYGVRTEVSFDACPDPIPVRIHCGWSPRAAALTGPILAILRIESLDDRTLRFRPVRPGVLIPEGTWASCTDMTIPFVLGAGATELDLGLPPGQYHFRAFAPGGLMAEVECPVTLCGMEPVRLTLEPGARQR